MSKKLLTFAFFGAACLIAAASSAQDISIEERWAINTGAAMFGRPAIEGEFLYVGGEDGIMRALNRATGDEVWQYDAGAAIGSTATVDAERVYFSAWDGSVHAIYKHDGSPVWRFVTQGEKRWDTWDTVLSTPIVDHERVYFGSGDHHIYGLNKRNGALRWKVKTGGIIHSEAALDGDRLLVGSFDGKLYGVDRSNGDVLWTFKTVGNAYFRNGAITSSPAVHDGVAYVGSRDYNIYAVLTSTGTGAWNHRSPSWVVAKPLVLDDTVYFPISNSPQLIALGKDSGDERWNTPLNLNTYGVAVGMGAAHVATAGEDGRINLIARDGSGIVAHYDSPSARANRDDYFDGDTLRQESYTSYRDFEAKYRAMLESLGAVVSGLTGDGTLIYMSDVAGNVIAVEVVGLPEETPEE